MQRGGGNPMAGLGGMMGSGKKEKEKVVEASVSNPPLFNQKNLRTWTTLVVYLRFFYCFGKREYTFNLIKQKNKPT